MYADVVEFKPEPRRHHRRTTTIVAVSAGLAIAFAGGWAAAPRGVDQVPQLAPRAAPAAAAPIEHSPAVCAPRHTPPDNLAHRLQPMTADATEAWLLALRDRRAMH